MAATGKASSDRRAMVPTPFKNMRLLRKSLTFLPVSISWDS
jgi:hypothetical protein